MKKMKSLVICFFSTALSVFLFSCQCHTTLDPHKKFTFLSRNIGSNNGWTIYSDYRLLNKDSARELSISEYVKLSQLYIDTVKADHPVSALIFYGVNSCIPNIYAGADDGKYAIIDIAFSNGLEQNADKKATVSSISLWKDGKPWKRYEPNAIMIMKGKDLIFSKGSNSEISAVFNSLINSQIPIQKFIDEAE